MIRFVSASIFYYSGALLNPYKYVSKINNLPVLGLFFNFYSVYTYFVRTFSLISVQYDHVAIFLSIFNIMSYLVRVENQDGKIKSYFRVQEEAKAQDLYESICPGCTKKGDVVRLLDEDFNIIKSNIDNFQQGKGGL